MEPKFCQSCGMPMTASEHHGTNADSTPNTEYCAYCYKEGAFTADVTMQEMIAECANFHESFRDENGNPVTRDQAIAMMQSFFPTLKRWQQA